MIAAAARCALFAVLIALPGAVHAAGKATVRNADAVNVREQPNLESPTIVALRKGRVVTVEKVMGGWAQITLDSGRKGYVKTIYLDLPAGIETAPEPTPAPAAPAVSAPTAPPTPEPTRIAPTLEPTQTAAAAAPATPVSGQDVRDGLESEVAKLRERLVALESAVVATPPTAGNAPPQGGTDSGASGQPALHEGEPTRAAGAMLPNGAARLEPEDIGPSLALAGLGLIVGFLLGAAYGRRQERNRRSRVRF